MITKPMYAIHKGTRGFVLGASNFKTNYELDSWLRSLDIRAGDSIEFGNVANRDPEPEFEPVKPAFLEEPEAIAEPEVVEKAPELADDEQPF